jgi:hypothetical protein
MIVRTLMASAEQVRVSAFRLRSYHRATISARVTGAHHIPHERLADMHMLDTNNLRATVPRLPQSFDLRGVGTQQPGRRGRPLRSRPSVPDL